MDLMNNYGGSISSLRLSRIGKTKDGHSTSEVLEDQITSKLGTLTQDGGKFSGMRMKALSMSRMARLLMFQEEEIKKVTVLEFGKRMVQRLKNGLSSIPTRKQRKELEV